MSEYPAAGATGVARNALIMVRLDKSSGVGCYGYTLTPSGGKSQYLSQYYSDYDSAYSEQYFTPASTLEPLTTYTVAASCGTKSLSFSFTTGTDSDTAGPRLVSISPDPAAKDISPYGPFIVRFDKPLLKASGVVDVYNGLGTPLTANARLTDDRQGIEVRPQYEYQIAPVVVLAYSPANVRDLNNNTGADAAASVRYLTTLVAGQSGPQVLGTYPGAAESNVATDAAVQILFDRAMDTQSSQNGGIVVEARGEAVRVSARSSGALIRLTDFTLLPNTTYRVRITTKQLDTNGVPVSTESASEFTTASGPEAASAASSIAGPQSVVVATNSQIVYRSSRRMPAFVPLMIKKVSVASGDSTNSLEQAVTARLQDDNRTLVLSAAEPFPALASVLVNLSSILDCSGATLSPRWSFLTSEQSDLEPPTLEGSTPSDGDDNVPVNTTLRFLLNEPVGLSTPATAVRLTREGVEIPGQFTIFTPAPDYPATWALEFAPKAPLDSSTTYQVELTGVVDMAGNLMPSRTIQFRTAANSTAPSTYPKLVSSSLDSGTPGPFDPITLEFNQPLKAGKTTASAKVTVARQYDLPLSFSHPVRYEISGSTVRIVPRLAWPGNRDTTLSVSGEDRWARTVSYSAKFQAATNGDTDRPEVTSISPAELTTLNSDQPIHVTFSKPMLNATQMDGGLTVVMQGYNMSPTIYWSDDRQTATVVPFPSGYGVTYPVTLFSLVVTSGLTDLSGNPAKAFTARYISGSTWVSDTLPSITRSWPVWNSQNVDARTQLTLYLSAAVDPAQFQRGIWLVTSDGRISGIWRFSSDGRLAAFQPDAPLPAGRTIQLKQVEPVLNISYGYSFSTAAATPSTLAVVRTSLHDPHPADAVIDIEFNQALPDGPGPLKLQTGSWQRVDVAFDEVHPRPNVLRLVPRAALPANDRFAVVSKSDSTLNFTWSGATTAAQAPSAKLLYNSPLDGSTGIGLNARISAVFSAQLNEISVNSATVKLSSGGVDIPFSVTEPAPGARLTLVPLAMLPANAKIDVTLSGLEDRAGNAIAAVSWSFVTGDSIDTTAPKRLYTNANLFFDPQVNLVLTYDKAIDAAFSDGFANLYYGSQITWSVSADLKSIYIMPVGGWKRGESYSYLSPQVYDWTGNSSSDSSLSVQAGFAPDRSAPEFRVASISDGQSGLPLNSTFALLFSEPLGAEALRSVRLVADSGDIPLSIKSSSGNRVVLNPPYLLSPNTNYQLVIEGVQDASGNAMADRVAISFSTGEILAEPNTTAAYLSRSASEPITVQYSRPVDITPLVDSPQILTWSDMRGGTGYTVTIPVHVTWNNERTQITITPRQSLTPGTTYTLQPGVSGAAGGSVSSTSYSFTATNTPDESPIQVRIVPADGSTGVPLNVNMSVMFSRSPVAKPAVRLYEDDTQVSATLGNAFQGYTTTNLITVQRSLKAGRRYRIEVDGFRDSFDNEIAPLSSTFETASANDTSYLKLVSSSPADGEAGVSTNTPWTFNFNLPLAPMTFQLSTPSSSRAMPFSSTTSVSGSSLIMTPKPVWPAAAKISYYLSSSNSYGVAPFISWTGTKIQTSANVSFYTAASTDTVAPVLESVEPASGSTIPGGKATVVLHFSEPVMLPSTGLQVFYGADKATPSGVLSQDYRTVTYTLLPKAGTTVSIVGTSDIRDNADNPITPFVLEYTVGEDAQWGPPSATMTEPANISLAPANTSITIRFDRAMDSGSVLAAFHVTENGQNKPGGMEVLEGGRTYRFTPWNAFQASASVKVFVLGTAQDTTGVFFTPNSNWPLHFFIASTPSTTSLELAQRGFSSTAPVDATLEFELNAELDSTSVNSDSVWLRRGSRVVAGEVSLRDGRIVQFRPSEPLEVGAEYALTAGAALRDVDGRTFAGQEMTFRATPAEVSADVESVIETECEGRRAVRVRFTRPVSPLAVHGLSLDIGGAPVSSQTSRTTDDREFLVVLDESSTAGELHLNLERVPEANGRLLPFRRLNAARMARVQ